MSIADSIRAAKLTAIKALLDEIVDSYDRQDQRQAEDADRIRAIMTKPMRLLEHRVTGGGEW